MLEPNRHFCFGVTSGSEVSANRWSAAGQRRKLFLLNWPKTKVEGRSSRADRRRTGLNLGQSRRHSRPGETQIHAEDRDYHDGIDARTS